MDRRFRLARRWSNDELRRICALFDGKVVNVSAGENLDKEGSSYDSYFPQATGFWITNHGPGRFRGFQGRDNELLLDLSKPIGTELSGRFDVVLNHTTLEHIFEVETAFANLCKLSKDTVIVVVPFAQVQHENSGYEDYWRFTPTCLRRMFGLNGLEVVYESASPARDAAIYLLFVGSRYPDKWQDRMPEFERLHDVGAWIGDGRRGARDFVSLSGEWISAKLKGWRKP
jgi:hypothetical protein